MEFFDRKKDVLDVKLTSYGRHLLSKGRLKPVYYAFFDDDIIYDSNFFYKKKGFGKRIKRKSLCLSGFFDKGYNEITFYIDLKDLNFLINEK